MFLYIFFTIDNWPDYGSQLTFEFVLTDDARFEHNQTSQAGHSSASGRSSRASGSNGDSSVVNSGSLNSSSFYSSLSESGTTSVSATIDTYTGTRSSHNSSSSSLKSMLKSISKGIHNQLKIGHSRDSSSTGSSSTGSSSTGSSTVSLSRRFVRVVYNDEPQLVGGKCQGYGYWCPYPLFMDMFGPYLISQDDYIKECKDKAEGVPDIEGSVPASGH